MSWKPFAAPLALEQVDAPNSWKFESRVGKVETEGQTQEIDLESFLLGKQYAGQTP